MDIQDLLLLALEKKASDLHLSTGLSPLLRIDGDLCKTDFPQVSLQEMVNLLDEIMSAKQRQDFENQLESDFSLELKQLARVRVNVFQQLRGLGAVFRLIPKAIPCLVDLELADLFRAITSYSQGLILVTGPAGSGKSTTLAALINHINETRCHHILTIEDPIEFVHLPKQCLISQREVHRDTHSFTTALRAALREDPNVLLIGELRDTETIRLALTAAETGHLVLASLHTNSAPKTINRIIDAFTAEEQARVRAQLAESLQVVVAQNLVKKRGGGRILACEIMHCTPAIRNLIREDKIAQIYSFIQTGQAQGMQTLDQHLGQLSQEKLIEPIHASMRFSEFQSI